MSHQWGRVAGAGKWQRAAPVWFTSVIVLAVASGIAVWLVRQTFVWTPLQQFYLSAYTRSALASSLGIRAGRYRVLTIVNRRGSRLAIDEEVVPVTTERGDTTFALSELARQAGSGRLVWRDLMYDHARLDAQFRRVDLREPDPDGAGAAVADRDVRRGDRWPAHRDSEGYAVGTLAPSWPALEGTGAGVRAAV